MNMNFQAKKYFYLYALPLIWMLTSIVSYFHPGDEYALYGTSCIAGTWIDYCCDLPNIHSLLCPLLISTTGTVVMLIPSLMLYKLKTPKKLWLILYIFFAMFFLLSALTSYPSLKKALSKNGSYTAYIAGALNMGLYVSIILSIIITGIKRSYSLLIKKKK